MNMKKILALVLALTMAFSLAACSQEPADPTDAPKPSETDAPTDAPTNPPETDPPAADDVYAFPFEGTDLVPGAAFDATAFPEADSVYTVPSCAFDGTDNVYNYTDFEVTAYNDGTQEVIYSVYILDPNTATPEGLYLGDSASRVTELYGEDYTEDGSARVYQKGQTQFIVILSNEAVSSIEYRWVS